MQQLAPNVSISGVIRNAPVFLMVGVEWCGHCRRAKPVMEKVASAMGKAVPVLYVDGDGRPDITKAMGIRGFPALVYFDAKGRAHRYEGDRTMDAIVNFVCEKSSSGTYGFCNTLM